MAGALLVALMTGTSPGAGPAEPSAPWSAAVVLETPDKLPDRIVTKLREVLRDVLSAAGGTPVSGETLNAALAETGVTVAACAADASCLAGVAERCGAEGLLVVDVTPRKGKRFGASVRVWSDAGIAEPMSVAPVLGRQLVERVRVVGAQAIAGWRATVREGSAEATARAEGEVDVEAAGQAEVDVEAASATPVAPAVPSGQAEAPALVESASPASGSTFSLQIGIGGGVVPVVHRATDLRVGGQVQEVPFVVPAVDLELRVRIPGLPLVLDELYGTLVMSWAFDLPVVLSSFAAGVEKRWLIDRWAPLVGARYVLCLVGLPVPTAGGGEGLATALAHGVEGYAGIAVSLDPVPLWLRLTAGYRLEPKGVNQLSAGDDVYYARDTRSAIWVVDLSGLVASLGVVYAF